MAMPQREWRRVVAQGDSREGAERVAGGNGTRGGGDQESVARGDSAERAAEKSG